MSSITMNNSSGTGSEGGRLMFETRSVAKSITCNDLWSPDMRQYTTDTVHHTDLLTLCLDSCRNISSTITTGLMEIDCVAEIAYCSMSLHN